MSGESIGKRKWWHCTLNIKDRDSAEVLTSITSVKPSFPASNAKPNTVFAYSSYDCSLVNVPVRSFDVIKSPGYFVFMPSLDELEDCIIDIETYQDSININNRRIFEFIRTASYNLNCETGNANNYDNFPHETTTKDLSSNVFRYPEIPSYSQIGCCQIELLSPSTDLPSSGSTERPTRIWYITKSTDPSTNNFVYSLYSYDYALLSGALVFRGDIDVSISPEVELYDITWIPLDNTLLVICSDGIRRLYSGSYSTKAKLGELSVFDRTNLPNNFSIFPISETDAILYEPKIEYNIYDASLYVFYPIYTNQIFSQPAYIKMEYSEITGVKYISHAFINAQFSNGYKIGGLAYPSDYYSDSKAYCILNNSLAKISEDGVITTVESDNNLFAGMATIAFIQNPDETISEDILYSSNYAGQLFRVDTDSAVPINTGYMIGASTIGSSTTINGEDTRVSPFPFVLGRSHWLFLVDRSASMSGQRMDAIISAFRNMMQNYIRYDDKITIIGFNDESPITISKQLKTYSDANEIISYLETFFIPNGISTNFCSVISNIHSQFNDLKNVFILSDGTFDDCGSEADFPNTIGSSLNALLLSNPGVVVTSVGVMTSSVPLALQYISENYGPYVDWR